MKPVRLSPEAVEAIREALLEVFRYTGGEPDEDDVHPSPGVRDLEAKARIALRLLDAAKPNA